MEIKFDSRSCSCIKTLTDQLQIQEQTQEVRLPEGMPDVGTILLAWGRPVVRSKEWNGPSIRCSGGVMAWVVYADEDGQIHSTESWIPFQLRWELPQSERDGFILLTPEVRSLDARSLSPRKLMLRANIGVRAQALLSAQQKIYLPPAQTENVQILTHEYPILMPVEAGEKHFSLDEELEYPGEAPEQNAVLYYDAQVHITERKLMGSRLVFKGEAAVHLACKSDSAPAFWDAKLPFAQYADLEGDYAGTAEALVDPIVTDLELTSADGKLRFRCDLAAQYRILDRQTLSLAVDAYSPGRDVSVQTASADLTQYLDHYVQEVHLEKLLHTDSRRLPEVAVSPGLCQVRMEQDGAEITCFANVRVGCYDEDERLQWLCTRLEGSFRIACDPGVCVRAAAQDTFSVRTEHTPDGLALAVELPVSVWSSIDTGPEMLSAIEPGPQKVRVQDGPSLVLCRYGGDGLWALARQNGSTVEAICKANRLSGEPETGKMLLIPLL